MARALTIAAAVLALLLALLGGLFLFFDEDRLLAMASARLEQQTGARLKVRGPVDLALLPRLELALRDARLAAPDDGPTLHAGLLETGIAVLPLLGGTLEIDRLALRDLTVTTVAEAASAPASTANLSRAALDALYAARRRARREAASRQAGMVALPLALDVRRLSIRDARLRTEDAAGETLAELVLERFDASDVNSAGRPVQASAVLRRPAVGEVPALELALKGRFVTDLPAQRLTLETLGATVTGAAREPLTLSLTGTVDLRRQRADLALDFALADARGSGDLVYARFQSPQIDAQLSANRLSPALLALGGPGAAAAPAAPAAAVPYDALRGLDTRARLHLGEVTVGAHRLRAVDATLRAVEGTVTISDATARLHGGEVALTATLDARYAPASVDSEGSVRGLSLGRLLEALEVGLAARGSADLDWTLTSRGGDADALLRALAGPLRLRTEAVTLEDIGLEATFCGVVALLRQEALTATFPTDTAFTRLEADARLDGGSARLARLEASTAALDLAGDGRLGLVDGDFEATLAARLAPGFGERDRACRLDERLAALTWPVSCRGNIADEPRRWCRLDTATLVERALREEAESRLRDRAGKLLEQLFDGD